MLVLSRGDVSLSGGAQGLGNEEGAESDGVIEDARPCGAGDGPGDETCDEAGSGLDTAPSFSPLCLSFAFVIAHLTICPNRAFRALIWFTHSALWFE